MPHRGIIKKSLKTILYLILAALYALTVSTLYDVIITKDFSSPEFYSGVTDNTAESSSSNTAEYASSAPSSGNAPSSAAQSAAITIQNLVSSSATTIDPVKKANIMSMVAFVGAFLAFLIYVVDYQTESSFGTNKYIFTYIIAMGSFILSILYLATNPNILHLPRGQIIATSFTLFIMFIMVLDGKRICSSLAICDDDYNLNRGGTGIWKNGFINKLKAHVNTSEANLNNINADLNSLEAINKSIN